MDFPRGIAQIVSIPGGAAGTEATVKYMVQLAVSDAKEPEMVQYARRIVSDVPSKDYEGEARAIFEFVRSNVRYRLDPRGLEWVQRPFVTLLVDGAGDCDCTSTLVACLALCLGHGAAFKTVKVDPDRPEEYSHVYPLIGIRNKSNKPVWLAADTTQKGVDLGWEPPPERVLGSKTWILAEP